MARSTIDLINEAMEVPKSEDWYCLGIEQIERLVDLVREDCAQVAEMANMAQVDIARVIRERKSK